VRDAARTGLPEGDGTRPAVASSGLERKVHRLINRERERHGLAPLVWDDALARIARGHSRDMFRRRYFSHASPEGHDLEHRYAREGYRCAINVGNIRYEGAENIALNNLYDAVRITNGKAVYAWNSEERIAETTVRGWMDSPGHRRNILTPHWRKEGIGVAIDPEGRVYLTQNFC
jgi:uncharacterized protein YkwD